MTIFNRNHSCSYINLVKSTCSNLVEHVNKPIEPLSKPLVLFHILVKLVFVQSINITIPPNTFQQYLPNMFFQHEVGEMEIDEMLIQIRVQILCIARLTIIEEEQLTKINLGAKENLQ